MDGLRRSRLGLAREQHLFTGVVYGVTTLYLLQQQALRRLHPR